MLCCPSSKCCPASRGCSTVVATLSDACGRNPSPSESPYSRPQVLKVSIPSPLCLVKTSCTHKMNDFKTHVAKSYDKIFTHDRRPRHLIGWTLTSFSRQDLILENLALRQQLLALHTNRPRRRLSSMHKLFWIALRRFWSGWKKPLILVTPKTVVAWRSRLVCCIAFSSSGITDERFSASTSPGIPVHLGSCSRCERRGCTRRLTGSCCLTTMRSLATT